MKKEYVMKLLTEDEVRDKARDILKIGNIPNVDSGVGQITTFNKLGFDGMAKKPDGWYLPHNKQDVAVVIETKAERYELTDKYVSDLDAYIQIVQTKYSKVIGILYNGRKARVFKGKNELINDGIDTLQSISFYTSMYNDDLIDKELIYTLTSRINNSLHFDFGIKNLYHRMIFTSCALVAKRFNAFMASGMDYSDFHNSILNSLNKEMRSAKTQNLKLQLLADVFTEIKMNLNVDSDEINEREKIIKLISQFIDWISQISDNINSDAWRGEDVMGIFFNEFNRYKTKSESGQVFTPEHITDFIYKLLDVGANDVVLDAACGTGGFLVKSMANMLHEVGGPNSDKAIDIKSKQLYGIEFDREIYALACANMLIHKDGKTNLECLDTRGEAATEWIRKISYLVETSQQTGEKKIKLTENPVTKVLMNPPFETKYGCMDIVYNVLSNVPKGVDCAFILPDKKLEKTKKSLLNKIFDNNRLEKIIKLPEKTFSEGVVASVFIFKAGVPQSEREIFTCYIEDDGFESVKNMGRHDVNNKWTLKRDYWLNVIQKQSGDSSIQWIKPKEHLSYQQREKEFKLSTQDFVKTSMDYEMYLKNIDEKEFKELVTDAIFYGSNSNIEVTNPLKDVNTYFDCWKKYEISEIFKVSKGTRLTRKNMVPGTLNFIGASAFNNGVTNYISNTAHLTMGHKITVSYNGSVGSSFYQKEPFWASDDVNILEPIDDISKEAMLFFATLTRLKGERYQFIEKWTKEIMETTKIPLPSIRIEETGTYKPDWKKIEKFMDDVINHSKKRLEFLTTLEEG